MPSELHLSKEGYALATVQSACHALAELADVDLGFALEDGVPQPLAAPAAAVNSPQSRPQFVAH